MFKRNDLWVSVLCVLILGQTACVGYFVIPTGVQCYRDSDCPAGHECSDSKCYPTCGDTSECPGGSACTRGLCLPPYCGDGLVLEGQEQCDTGGESATCDSDCTLVECGDGHLNATAGELCEPTLDADCTTACAIDVRVGLAVCGDSIVTLDEGEVCDDGLNDGLYGGCATTCRAFASFCGDGALNASSGETCDAGTSSNTGAYGGCKSDCTKAAFCGDGAINASNGEACDNGTSSNTGAYNGCNANCTRPARCGDGVVQAAHGEICDDGDAGNTGGYGQCKPDCTLDVRCGDSVVQAVHGETCDDGVNDGSYGCATDCTNRASAYCGDGAVDALFGEYCDDGIKNGLTGCCQTACDGITNTALYVSSTGTDSPTCGSSTSPCRSISLAQARAECSKVIVLPGVYDTTSGETFPIDLDPGAVLIGDLQNCGAGATPISIVGRGAASCGSINDAAIILRNGARISGFRIVVPNDNPPSFGIIGRKGMADPSFHVNISCNTFDDGKGGVCLEAAQSSIISNNIFRTLEWGIFSTGPGSSLRISNNHFLVREGASISILHPTNTSHIVNNLFEGAVDIAQGVEVQQGTPLVESNIFRGPLLSSNPNVYGGFFLAAVYVWDLGAPILRSNTFTWNNASTIGVWVTEDTSTADLGTASQAGNNNFSAINSVAVENDSATSTIQAIGNTWPHATPTCTTGAGVFDLVVPTTGSIVWGTGVNQDCP